MLEIFQAQAETDAPVGAHDAPEFIEISRLAISGQAHDFEFIAEFAESEILRNGGVVHPQRVREGDGAVDVHAIALARSPHGAGEIAQAVRGEQRRLFERRNKKRARQMRLVMLDAMKFSANFFRRNIKGLRQRLGNAHKSGQDFGAFAGKTRHLHGVQKFRPEARPGVARNGDVIHFRERDAGGIQAVANRRRRKSRRVLDAVKAFLLDSGNQAAVADNRRRSIAVIRVNPKNVHPEVFLPALRPWIRCAGGDRGGPYGRCGGTLNQLPSRSSGTSPID